MDIVEFAENVCGAKLFEWQKEYLKTLDRLYNQAKADNSDVRIVMVPRSIGRMYTYFKLEELIPNGTKNDCKR